MRTAVVYLARFAEGVDPVQRFVDSYRRISAGVPHDLVIVWKGFPNEAPAGSPQWEICSDLHHQPIIMSDDGFDITAYRLAAQAIDHDLVCFLNTFSEIKSDCWLKKLHEHATRPDVGIAGSTGSYESLGHGMKSMCKVVWFCANGAPYDALVAKQWGHEIVKHAPQWLRKSPYDIARRALRRILGYRPPDQADLEARFEIDWKPHAVTYDRFPPFPNPHVRSNAFMMRRDLFLQTLPDHLETKIDAFEFESGSNSATKQVLAMGLKAIVVGHDGRGYEPNEWPSSFTFRRGSQHNKLVADNQTRSFDEEPSVRKEILQEWSWGIPVTIAAGDDAAVTQQPRSRLSPFGLHRRQHD